MKHQNTLFYALCSQIDSRTSLVVVSAWLRGKTTLNAIMDLVDRFASALDRDDFNLAITLISPDCVYEMPTETLIGQEAVLKSFRDATEWAHKNLDAIKYTHTIEKCGDCSLAIRFVDYVEHQGKTMRHQCLMHVILGGEGKVEKLRLEDLPGEKQKVADFLQSVGVKR